jgi:hypothetical protein
MIDDSILVEKGLPPRVYAKAKLKFDSGTKYIFLMKVDKEYVWFDKNADRLVSVEEARNVADAKINAWSKYQGLFEVVE